MSLLMMVVHWKRAGVCLNMSRIRYGILSVLCWVDLLVDIECIFLKVVSCSRYSCALDNIRLVLVRVVQYCSLSFLHIC